MAQVEFNLPSQKYSDYFEFLLSCSCSYDGKPNLVSTQVTEVLSTASGNYDQLQQSLLGIMDDDDFWLHISLTRQGDRNNRDKINKESVLRVLETRFSLPIVTLASIIVHLAAIDSDVNFKIPNVQKQQKRSE